MPRTRSVSAAARCTGGCSDITCETSGVRNLVHERRVQMLAMAAGFPGVLTSMIILYTGDYPAKVQWTLGLFIIGGWLGFASAARERVASPLRTLANLLEAMREGDYSIRARGAQMKTRWAK